MMKFVGANTVDGVVLHCSVRLASGTMGLEDPSQPFLTCTDQHFAATLLLKRAQHNQTTQSPVSHVYIITHKTQVLGAKIAQIANMYG